MKLLLNLADYNQCIYIVESVPVGLFISQTWIGKLKSSQAHNFTIYKLMELWHERHITVHTGCLECNINHIWPDFIPLSNDASWRIESLLTTSEYCSHHWCIRLVVGRHLLNPYPRHTYGKERYQENQPQRTIEAVQLSHCAMSPAV